MHWQKEHNFEAESPENQVQPTAKESKEEETNTGCHAVTNREQTKKNMLAGSTKQPQRERIIEPEAGSIHSI